MTKVWPRWCGVRWVGGRLTGKIRRGQQASEGRIAQGGAAGGPSVADDYLFNVIDALDKVAAATGKSVSQIALAWLLSRPSVANIVVGARNEKQLRENLGAVGWTLAVEHIKILDDASHRPPAYPYWHQMGFDEPQSQTHALVATTRMAIPKTQRIEETSHTAKGWVD